MLLSCCCLCVLRWLGRLQMIVGSFRRAGMHSFVGSYVLLLLMVAAAAVSLVCIAVVRMRLLWYVCGN